MKLKLQKGPAEAEILDADALAWAKNNPIRNHAGAALNRFAGCLTWARVGDGYTYDSKEIVVHVEALDELDAANRIESMIDVLAPELSAKERTETARVHNVRSAQHSPAFVLRAVLGGGYDHEQLDENPVWLCPIGGIWPGLYAQFNRPPAHENTA